MHLDGKCVRSFPAAWPNHASIERGRDGLFMRYYGIEIGARSARFFDESHQAIQAAHPIDLVAVPQFGRLERPTHEADGLIVSFQGDGEWMTVLATVGERESRGVRESGRRSMDNLGDQSQ